MEKIEVSGLHLKTQFLGYMIDYFLMKLQVFPLLAV